MRIAFLGLGIMGVPMCRNLRKAGHELAVWNRTPERFAPLAELGVTLAATPREAAAGAEAVFLMLTGPAAIDAVLSGPDGALAGLGPGKTCVNMSTVSPAYTRDVARRVLDTGAAYLDCPVSGSKKPAEEGTLVLLAGGDAATVAAMTPTLLCLGKKVVHCGPVPAGSMMKMAINLLLATMLEGLSEMLRLGQRGGLETRTMLDVLLAGPLANALFKMKEEMFLSEVFPPQFPLKHMAKDLGFVAETATELGATIPETLACLEVFRQAMDMGLGDEDVAAVFKALA